MVYPLMAKDNLKSEEITTIKLYRGTKVRLDKLKEHSRESYDELVQKILFILNALKKDPVQAQQTLNKIDSTIKRHEKYTDVYEGKNEGDNR